MKPKCAITRKIKSEKQHKSYKSGIYNCGVQKIVSLVPRLSRLRSGRAQHRDMSEYQAHDQKTPFCIIPLSSFSVSLFRHQGLRSEIVPCLQRSSMDWEASASLVDVESQQSHCSGRSFLHTDYSTAFRTLS